MASKSTIKYTFKTIMGRKMDFESIKYDMLYLYIMVRRKIV